MIPKKEQRTYPPVVVRSRLGLELASELVAMPDWPHKQVRITMRDQGAEAWGFDLFASDAPYVIDDVAQGKVQLAICNPGAVLTLAFKGTGPYKEPIPVRAVTVIGSYDQLVLAVTEASGITSLTKIRERKYPLRLSVRGQRDHSIHLVLDELLKAAGFSYDDIVSWGGEVRYDDGLPHPTRTAAVERGEVDAIFDEAANNWTNAAVDAGMRVLPIEEPILQQMESIGFRRGIVDKETYEKLPADVVTLDYSGFIVYTRADVPDAEIRAICKALEARRELIPRDQGTGPLPLDRMCRDVEEGPLDIPLHPAAEAFWREQGYLS